MSVTERSVENGSGLPRRVVVTGASGNLGTALLRRLVPAGVDVVGIARRVPAAAPPYDGVTWKTFDVADPGAGPLLEDALAGADAVVNLVWALQPSRDRRRLHETGVGNVTRLLAAMRATGVDRLVHASSIGAYSPGPKDHAVDESWPTQGIPSLPYSRHKALAERMLDHADQDGLSVARIRPGLVLQRAAGGEWLRYFAGGLVPPRAVRLLPLIPLLPLPSRAVGQVVHADDVADAVVRILERGATGAFNLAADPVVTPALVGEVLGARPVPAPASVLRALVDVSWHARLQPVEPGWLDLALAVPVLDTTRAQDELGWKPTVDAVTAIHDALAGMGEGAGTASPVLRPQTSALTGVRRTLREGPVGSRPLS